MPPVDLTSQYTFRVVWSEDDQEFVGLCVEFPSLSWLAPSQEAALAGIREATSQVALDLETAWGLA
jgi:hypothetical protein